MNQKVFYVKRKCLTAIIHLSPTLSVLSLFSSLHCGTWGSINKSSLCGGALNPCTASVLLQQERARTHAHESLTNIITPANTVNTLPQRAPTSALFSPSSFNKSMTKLMNKPHQPFFTFPSKFRFTDAAPLLTSCYCSSLHKHVNQLSIVESRILNLLRHYDRVIMGMMQPWVLLSHY